MRVWTCLHDGIWLGGCSVIVAESEEQARALIVAELRERQLCDSDIELREVDTRRPQVIMLANGDY
jgi:hypothetical protein